MSLFSKFTNGRSRARCASDSRRSHMVGRLVGVPLPYHVELEALGATLGVDRQPFEPVRTYAARLAATVALQQSELALITERLRPFIEE